MITLSMWQNLARIGAYSARRGFKDFAQPWIGSHRAIHATLPPGAIPTLLDDGQILLGSAEQAFIDCMLEGQMPVGKWQATTPCFRREPVLDALHRPYFMKLELIDYMPASADQALWDMLELARYGFMTILPTTCPDVEVEKTGLGFDLTLRGQEIGSYGIREYEGHRWVYGTGLAEPRFTTLVEMLEF